MQSLVLNVDESKIFLSFPVKDAESAERVLEEDLRRVAAGAFVFKVPIRAPEGSAMPAWTPGNWAKVQARPQWLPGVVKVKC